MNDDKEGNKYTWNDSVIIKNGTPNNFQGEVGVVCGISKIEDDEIADKYFSKVGDWIYTIEFKNGSDIQVAECYLDTYMPNKK